MMQREPEEQAAEVEAEVGEEDIGILKQALAKEKEKAESYLANWQRVQADFINYKRRVEQEKAELSQLATSSLMLGLLPVLDDLERAFASFPPELAEVPWVDGVRLVERKLRTILEAQGFAAIKALGEPFDPRLHEAVRQTKGQEGIVIAEVQKGYRLGGRVLRASKVMVGNGEAVEDSAS